METCKIINETVSLMALGSGVWEYYNIGSMDELKEAYEDFDNRVAWGGDIELQYIDGCLSGYSCSEFEKVLELQEEYNIDMGIIRDVLNATTCIKETERIIENQNYMYMDGNNELDAFDNYLIETGFYESIPEHIKYYIDVEKVYRDYYIRIYNTGKDYLFILE
ncbi:MAG: hypothetical protein ACRCXT_14400 [Paraclostridium sp.]